MAGAFEEVLGGGRKDTGGWGGGCFERGEGWRESLRRDGGGGYV